MTATSSTVPGPPVRWAAHPGLTRHEDAAQQPRREDARPDLLGDPPVAAPAHASAPAHAPAPAHVPARPRRPPEGLLARARALWPGLPSRQLAGTRGDPLRIVRLVGRRSNEAPEVLLAMLLGPRAGASRR